MVRPAPARRSSTSGVCFGEAESSSTSVLWLVASVSILEAQHIRKLGRFGIVAGRRGDGVEAHAAERVENDRRGEAMPELV